MTYIITSVDYPDYSITIDAPMWAAVGTFEAITKKEKSIKMVMRNNDGTVIRRS